MAQMRINSSVPVRCDHLLPAEPDAQGGRPGGPLAGLSGTLRPENLRAAVEEVNQRKIPGAIAEFGVLAGWCNDACGCSKSRGGSFSSNASF